MLGRIRFHLDENVDPDVARALRRYGIDVTTTAGAGLHAASDSLQLDHARAEGRVLVTHDADFLRMSASGANHAGVVYGHRDSLSTGEIIRMLLLIYEVMSLEEMSGRVEFLSYSP
jgi:predicted nuclease of predicted toxin-antitoxin system